MAGRTDEAHSRNAHRHTVEAIYALLDLLKLPDESTVVAELRAARKEFDAIRVKGEHRTPAPAPDEPSLPTTQEQGAT